jgi:D-sedoheptulose 7-phosphate isomerase
MLNKPLIEPSDYLNHLIETLHNVDWNKVYSLADVMQKHFKTGSTIFVFGNGGSAATASHFAQDISKKLGFRIICLNDNIPSLLAYGNDDGFVTIFKNQLEKLIKPTDMIIGISCSGMSANVISAILYGNQQGCLTVGFTGFNGGDLVKSVDIDIHVPCDDMQICEDIHLIISHIILRILK